MIVGVNIRPVLMDDYYLKDERIILEEPLTCYVVDITNDGRVVWARMYHTEAEAEAVRAAAEADIRAQLPDALPFVGPNTRSRRRLPPADS